MTIDSINAARAYAQIAQVAGNAQRTDNVADAAKPDFSSLVADAVKSTQESLKAGDAAAASVAAGEASLVDVVTAVSAAEVTLETAIAVRNRVIDAYQQILRMPI
ncbi:MAG: flagellar hook-basal body complex protein FliE [Marinicaulis sp.]|nr:flagellar hook-basal body complex protein FliE [Marinicaulis sp.]NNE41208.1 flagellar hook-basal body complex protein FliE [Marinicaulis sp.]NNL88364.1 flagellar hook-basal body complex protein FliE [Marinicaulis sp.]